mmetsp:Transcript_11500/g.23705  ORF Transcript_11500/g.23705 Transcript_11500/m.23705 type:complete len:327 (+) Transcript_11500:3-983(+)
MGTHPAPLNAITGEGMVGAHQTHSVHSPHKGHASVASSRSSCLPAFTKMFSSKRANQAALLTGSCCASHPDKSRSEDVLVISTCCGMTLMGVLDGVGEWTERGVDASLYPRKLENFLKDEFTTWAQGHARKGDVVPPKGDTQPLRDILVRAHRRLQKLELRGSTTACLAMLFPNGQLHVLNLGDSGLRVVRDGVQIFETESQRVSFNAPKQLGYDVGEEGSYDSPQDSSYNVITLQSRDAILIASDGLWDNVWDKEWQADVVKVFRARNAPAGAALAGLAAELCSKAQRYGCDMTYESPFAVQARAEGEEGGGKLDDTTILVGCVA